VHAALVSNVAVANTGNACVVAGVVNVYSAGALATPVWPAALYAMMEATYVVLATKDVNEEVNGPAPVTAPATPVPASPAIDTA